MFFSKNRKETTKATVITDANFEEIATATGKPILIDFWAPWCGPCKVMGPVIDELAEEYEGKAIVGKVNVDENPGLSNHFQVRSIPTIMVVKNKKVVVYQPGLVPKPNMAEILDRLIEEKTVASE